MSEQGGLTKGAEEIENAYKMKPSDGYYDQWAPNYDADVHVGEYKGPELLVGHILKIVTDKKAAILDVGAGTGPVGGLLKEFGYTNLDAIDGSQKMLEVAKKKGIYRSCFHELLQPNQSSQLLRPGHYDAAVGTGIFSPNHLSGDHLPAIASTVKPGGYVILIIKESWLDGHVPEAYNWWNPGIESKIMELEERGVWKLVQRLRKNDYVRKEPGIFFCFKKLL